MGLRINTNVTALRALRNLSINDTNQAKSLERLSTGLKINRGSDDPSGLVISEQLRGQLSALGQAVDNSQNASNLISTADAALQGVSNLLVDIQSSVVFAQNTGGSSPSQISAEQEAVDQAITAIDRIAATTRFSDRALLNGTVGFTLLGNRPAELNDLRLRSVNFAGGSLQRDLTVTPVTNPQRGTVRISDISGTSVGGAVMRISGPRGTEDITIVSGAGAQQIASAINSVAGFTGIFASGTGNAASDDLHIFTEEFGGNQLARIEMVSGDINAGAVEYRTDDNIETYSSAGLGISMPFSTGDVISDRGLDAQIQFEGQLFTGEGRNFKLLTRVASLDFNLNPDLVPMTTGSSGNITISVGNTGLNFQLNELARPTDRLAVGIDSVAAGLLGKQSSRDRIEESIAGVSSAAATGQILAGGFLNTLKTGGDNDLTSNPGNASTIVKAAINQVATLRGFLGAIQADAIQPNIDSLGVAIENLTSSLSNLRDLDFAEATSEFTRTQILFQSGIAVLASSNLIPQSILTLLR